jgi:hypothetical protein
MFHFPAFPPHTLYIQVQVTGHDSSQVSPFGHPRITARLPTPQGLSQATTSFIGSRCQGIHHVPFIACHHHKHTPPPTQQPPQQKEGAIRHSSEAHSRHEHTPPSPNPTTQEGGPKHTRDAAQDNCYKDARVHYEKTKHPAPQPTNPTTRRDQQQAGTDTTTPPSPDTKPRTQTRT